MAQDKNGLLPTGNEYLCLPTLREADGALESFNIILMGLDGLLEFAGSEDTPLLRFPGLEQRSGAWTWSFREDWIPEFRHDEEEDRCGRVVAPPGQRFFFYQLPERGEGALARIHLGALYQTANTRHRLPHPDLTVGAFHWADDQALAVNVYLGSLTATVMFRVPNAGRYFLVRDGKRHELRADREPVSVSLPVDLEVVSEGDPTFVVSAGFSNVGTISANEEVGRLSADTWLQRAEAALAEKRAEVPADPALAVKANRNGHFARYYAMGRTLDTDEPVSMTSRSYRYYVSSAYWDRDSLLWLFPFLVRNDRQLAADLLGFAFGRQLDNTGIHSRYISGRILEYGFELDELLAPLTALGLWARVHPDIPLWDDPGIEHGVMELLDRLRRWRHPDLPLYRTELMPTDDEVIEGRDLLTYDNALTAHTLAGLVPVLDDIAPERVAPALEEVDGIRGAVREHLVRDGVFMWAGDGAGSTEFYDEAAGSLVLLPYLGFCDRDDPVYKATLDRLYSDAYPYRKEGRFSDLGNRHTEGDPHPWVLSACSGILSGSRVEEGLRFLRDAPLDHGIACESVNVDTGEPETGFHFATCAGFVAHAIMSHERGDVT